MTTKVSSAMQDLTDDYAFSGTVSGAGKVVQVVKTVDAVYASGTTETPYDDSIPTSSEGTEFTALATAITPTNASNILRITVSGNFGGSIAMWHTIALFKDSDAAASHVAWTYTEGSTRSTPTHIVFHVVAGGVSSQTWKVRGGGHVASTVTINGDGGARKFGGVGHSFMQIEEIAV
jgi:hypothetical protein